MNRLLEALGLRRPAAEPEPAPATAPPPTSSALFHWPTQAPSVGPVAAVSPAPAMSGSATAVAEAHRPAVVESVVTDSEIEQHAYQLWRADGCPAGRDVYYWLRAEAELKHR